MSAMTELPPAHDLRDRAVAAALAVARAHGLAPSHGVVARDLSNVLVALAPLPVIARVATTVAGIRGEACHDHMAREVALAAFLAARGLAVVPPADELPPGPHRHDGLYLTFWRLVDHDGEATPDAAAIGHALRSVHGALAAYPAPLPLFDPLAEVDRLLDRLTADAAIGPADLAMLRAARARLTPAWAALAAGPVQALHGDAHTANVLHTPAGPLWTDWEDAAAGPVEWDLACLVNAGRSWGPPDPVAEAALAAYGIHDPARLAACLDLRALLVAAWVIYMGRRHAGRQARVEARLAYWRARQTES